MATKSSIYEEELKQFCVSALPKAVCCIVIEGKKGSSFEVRCADEKYMRLLPKVLIELASKIEGDLAERDKYLAAEKLKEKTNGSN